MTLIQNSPTLTRIQFDALIRDFVEGEFDEANGLKRAAAIEPILAEAVTRQRAEHPRLRKWLARAIASGDYRPVQAHFYAFLDDRGINSQTPSYGEAIKRLSIAWLETLAALDRGEMDLAGKLVVACEEASPGVDQTLPPSPSRASVAHGKIGSSRIVDLIEPYMRERQRAGIGSSYLTEIRTGLSWFSQWFGETTQLATLKPEDLRDFKDGLLALPKNWTKVLKGISIREAVELNADGHLPRLEVMALKGKRWQPVVEFLSWAHRDLYIPSNPAIGLIIPVSRSHKRASRRDMFDMGELQKIFAAPVFRGALSDSDWKKPGSHQIRDYRFWLPLLGLYTGGRRGELCPLRVEDVIERNGILCLLIREHFDDDGAKVSSVKNEESKRIVPVHPELLKIGFKSFVEERRALKAERLFDCPDSNNFDQFGKWFSRLLVRVGVKTTRNTYHSFRHTIEQAMRENIEDFTARCRITGRTVDHSSEEYGTGHTIETLFREISKAQYVGLDLSELYEPAR